MLLFLCCLGILSDVHGASEDVKYIIYGLDFDTTQSEIDVIVNFARLRDYYNRSDENNGFNLNFRYPYVAATQLVAAAMNASLVSFERKKICPNSPTLVLNYDNVVSSDFSDVAYRHWIQYQPKVSRNVNAEVPKFIQISTDMGTCVYCDFPKKVKTSVWKFTLFTDPLGTSTWILLCLSGGSAAITLSFKFKASNVILSIVGPLFPFGVEPPSKIKSELFTLWMVMSMILGNLYTGSVSSELIRPALDDIARNLSELKAKNFTAVLWLENQNEKEVVLAVLPVWRNSTKITKLLSWFLERAQFLPAMEQFAAMTMQSKTFSLFPSETLIGGILKIKKVARQIGTHVNKKCHVTEDHIFFSNQFVTILPPSNSKVEQVYNFLLTGGIFQRWNYERVALFNFNRVQDRVRFKGLRKYSDDEVESIEGLKMKGKMITVFLLWTICILISTVGFSIEFAWHAS